MEVFYPHLLFRGVVSMACHISCFHLEGARKPCEVQQQRPSYRVCVPSPLQPNLASFSGLCYATLLHASDRRPGCPWSNLLFRSLFALLSSLFFPFRGSFLQMTGSTFLLLAVSLTYGGHTGLV